MIATTGHDWNTIGTQWNIPRLQAWMRTTKGFPTLQFMVGHYLGYKPTVAAGEPQKRETLEESSARLMQGFTGMGR